MAIPSAPAGSYIQGNQIYLQNGQPYSYNNAPVYLQNGAYYQPNAQQNPSVYNFSFPGSPYNVLPPPTIGTPNAAMGATASGGTYTPPEINALNTIGQIDPGYLGLANKLQNRYGGSLNQSANYLRQANQQYQLLKSGQLPPGVQREIQQQVAGQEAGTGNTAGVAQAVQQGMTTGTEGYNLLQQALATKQNALSYNQGVLQQAGNYLTGGANPYAIGSNYVNNALNQQSAADSGGQVSYNPYGNAPAYSYINPGAGGEFAQGTTGFLNAGVGATPGSPDTSGQYLAAGVGATGAIIGGLAASGALAAF